MLYSQCLSKILRSSTQCYIFPSVTKGIQSCPWACLSRWATSVWSVNCEQSRVLPCWPWLPASRCILGSCGCRLAVWQSGLCPPPPHDNPHFPSALPRLDTRPHTHPSWAYHHFPSCHKQPHVHLGYSSVWKRWLFKHCSKWLGGKGMSSGLHAATMIWQLFSQ